MHRFLSLLLAVQANALKKVLVTGAGGRTGKGAPWWRKVLGVLSTHPSTEDRIERLRANRA